MPEKLVIVATYTNPFKARLDHNYLASEGIECHLDGAGDLSALSSLGGSFASVSLHVHEGDLPYAQRLLAEAEEALKVQGTFDDELYEDEDDEHEPRNTDLKSPTAGVSHPPQTEDTTFRPVKRDPHITGAPGANVPGASSPSPDDIDLVGPGSAAGIASRSMRTAVLAYIVFALFFLMLPPIITIAATGLLLLYSLLLVMKCSAMEELGSDASLRVWVTLLLFTCGMFGLFVVYWAFYWY